MILVKTRESNDPRINLATEEYVLKYLKDETYLLFYINEPSIIIGRNQNTIQEINQEYVNDNNIHVIRRLSGGGAVYHDLGNLNFSFITEDDGNSFHNFRKFTEPVIKALNKLGVPAELSGRNDILAEGRKISGNAQFAFKGRMFSHGTLLFASEIDNVVAALNVKMDKIQSKGIKSIRSRVANINEFMTEEIDMKEFKQQILEYLYAGYPSVPEYVLTDYDYEKIKEIADNRYNKWEWNYGESPAFNLKGERRFEGVGKIEVYLDVKHGLIEKAKIFGDFFGSRDIAILENMLVNTRFDEKELRALINNIDITSFFGNITVDEFMGLIFN